MTKEQTKLILKQLHGSKIKQLNELSPEEVERKRLTTRITTHTLRYLSEYFVEKGFEWIMPVILSKATDPLWPDPDFSIEKRIEIEIYGEIVRTTHSMIVHKQVLVSLLAPRIFIFSPNIRIEKRERLNTGIHGYEFTQLDFEIRGASSADVRKFVEELLREYVAFLRARFSSELKELGTYDLLSFSIPLKVMDSREAEEKYGEKWTDILREELKEPLWIVNIPREFYDYEDEATGVWDNYDLYVPRVGEILSGARREYKYDKIVSKMKRDGVPLENYKVLLSLAKEGRLLPSAGAGIGVERLLLWVTGIAHIGELQLFPRVPGIVLEL
jgi:asparaginyl-tRNA synthetase